MNKKPLREQGQKRKTKTSIKGKNSMYKIKFFVNIFLLLMSTLFDLFSLKQRGR